MVIKLLAEKGRQIKTELEYESSKERRRYFWDVQHVYRNVSLPSMQQNIQE